MSDTPLCPHCHLPGVSLGEQRSRDRRNGRAYRFDVYLCSECLSSFGGPRVYEDTGEVVSEREHEARHENE